MKETCMLCLFFLVLALACSVGADKHARYKMKDYVVVVGNFSLSGEVVNMAQYDVELDSWTNRYQAELFDADSNGVVLNVVVNSSQSGADQLFAVGSFDTMTKTSQMQFCSVSTWDGITFAKVGEGLCPRGADPSISTSIDTIAIGNDGDIFVGGTFESRVWDGHHFVNIFLVAQYHGISSSWLPLSGGVLQCQACTSTGVRSLAWDSTEDILYVSGVFDSLNDDPISPGIAYWSNEGGLRSFPGGGVWIDKVSSIPGSVSSIILENTSRSIFVAGNFRFVDNIECLSIAVWIRSSGTWKCLYQSDKGISTITGMNLWGEKLYVAGWASASSDWKGSSYFAPYAIAVLDLSDFVDQYVWMNASLDLEERSGRTLRRNEISINHFLPSSMPTGAPSRIPWEPNWIWLPSFAGGNGPILRVVEGKRSFSDCYFIVGAFNNYPSLSVLCDEKSNHSSQATLIDKYVLQGFVSDVVQMSLLVEDNSVPDDPSHHPTPTPKKKRISTISIVFTSGVLVAAIFGLIWINRRHDYRALSDDSPKSISTLEFPRLSMTEKKGDESPHSPNNMGSSSPTVDFRGCFERAMKARHLPSHESLQILHYKEIQCLTIIGEGAFGRVWSGTWRNNTVAIKEFVFSSDAFGSQRDHMIEEIIGEAGVMVYLRHPKILQLYGVSFTPQGMYLVNEYCNGGSLRMLLNDTSVMLSPLIQVSLALDIAEAMKYLHSHHPPIIHRDLKSHNIFVTFTSPNQYIAKIGDWGSARAIALSSAKTMSQGVGTACWLAPEVIYNAHFSKESDVYAFGIILWEIFSRNEVHTNLSAAQIIAKVVHEGLRPPIKDDSIGKELMQKCWVHMAKHRPNFFVIADELTQLYEQQLILERPSPSPASSSVSSPTSSSSSLLSFNATTTSAATVASPLHTSNADGSKPKYSSPSQQLALNASPRRLRNYYRIQNDRNSQERPLLDDDLSPDAGGYDTT